MVRRIVFKQFLIGYVRSRALQVEQHACHYLTGQIPGAQNALEQNTSRVLQVSCGSHRGFASLPDHSELQMPALSPTMSQGNLTSWEVKEGDEVPAGSILATIETDKATLEWENQDDGFIAKLLVASGTKDIAVGTPLAIVVEQEEDIPKFKNYSSGSSQGKSEPETTSASGDSTQNSDKNQKEIEETEKRQESGRKPDGHQRIGPAAKLILLEHGLSQSDVKGTGPYGIVTKADALSAVESGNKSQPPKQQSQQQEEGGSKKEEGAKKEEKNKKESKPVQASHNQPSGESTPSQGDKFSDIPNSQIRKIIATRLLESKRSVPHFYSRASAALDAVTQMRESMKSQGTKVSVNDFVVRAVALALAEVPAANAMWDSSKEEPRRAESVDVAIAVATDKGLITPILKAANTKSLKQISEEIRELAGKARANKLKPEEFQGGSFTISNLGMYGIDSFSAIINPPQAGILAVGGTQHAVVLDGGKPVSRSHVNVVLSADQRIFDGETTSHFLQAFCKNLENPVKLLV